MCVCVCVCVVFYETGFHSVALAWNSLCDLGCPGTHYNSLASASPVLGYKRNSSSTAVT